MRCVLWAAAAAAVFGIAAASLPPASAKPGGFGAKSGGGFKSSAVFKAGFKHGFHGKFGFHGRPSKGFRHAHRFHRPLFAFGLPFGSVVVRTAVLPRQPESLPRPVTLARVAEAKIYQAGTDGGCRSDRVSVPQGMVTVWRC